VANGRHPEGACIAYVHGPDQWQGIRFHLWLYYPYFLGFPDWNHQESDYTYFYVYDKKKIKVPVTRCAVDQFQTGFSWEVTDMVGFYEEKTKEQLNQAVEDSKARDYGMFIASGSDYIDTYYMVWFMIWFYLNLGHYDDDMYIGWQLFHYSEFYSVMKFFIVNYFVVV
jgi:hypothetical protein